MKGKWRTLFKVLAFVLVSVIFTIALAIRIGNMRLFAHTYSLKAVFADATGVFKGDAVKLAGVDVGRVTGAEIDHGNAVISFNVNEDIELTSHSVIGIRWRNVLGLRYLYVYPGDGQGRVLEEGDTVGLSNTQDAGDIGEFLNHLGPILRAIDPQKANQFLDAVNSALGGNEIAVRQLLTDGAILAGRLGQKDEQIKELIANSSKIMAAYASQSGNLGKILDDLDTLGGKLAGITDQVNSLVTNLADVQDQLARIERNNRGNIDATLSDLNSVAATLFANRVNLERTLCTLPPGVAPYFQTTSWGEWFNVRVTTVTFKDNNGNVISQADEAPNARGNSSGKVVTCGGPAPKNTAAASSSAPSNDLRAFLDFVMARTG